MKNDIKGCADCKNFETCLMHCGCISGVVKKRATNVFFKGGDCFEEGDNNEHS